MKRFFNTSCAAAAMVVSITGSTMSEPLLSVSTYQPASAVLSAIHDQADENGWHVLGHVDVGNGTITLVTVCLDQATDQVMSASAYCGVLAVHHAHGVTQVAMAHPARLGALEGRSSAQDEIAVSATAFDDLLRRLPAAAARQTQPRWAACWEAGCP